MKNTLCLSFITVKFDFQVANMERCKWHTNKASKLSVYFSCALLIYFNVILLATVEHSSSSRKFKNTCIILCKVMWGQFTLSVTVPAKLTIATVLNFDGTFTRAVTLRVGINACFSLHETQPKNKVYNGMCISLHLFLASKLYSCALFLKCTWYPHFLW